MCGRALAQHFQELESRPMVLDAAVLSRLCGLKKSCETRSLCEQGGSVLNVLALSHNTLFRSFSRMAV